MLKNDGDSRIAYLVMNVLAVLFSAESEKLGFEWNLACLVNGLHTFAFSLCTKYHISID